MAGANRFSLLVAKSPALWGGLLSAGFYSLVHAGVLDGEFVRQYFASHPVEYVATTLFFVGLAALGLKTLSVSSQAQDLGEPMLGPARPADGPAADCEALADRLRRLPSRQQNTYLVRRLRDALQYVRRCGSEGLDEELRYLADLDAHRVHSSYGLVRMIIWAIPILGFLGTVIGIALAIGKLAPQALEDSLPEVMAGLTVAFNTTALALALSMILMFALYLTERKENALLADVDQQAEAEMAGRFQRLPGSAGGEIATVRQMLREVIQATDGLVKRQSDLWFSTLQAAEQRWATLAETAGRQLETSLAAAMTESLREHAREVAAQEQVHAERNRRAWTAVQEALVSNTRALSEMQAALADKAETLGRAVQATDQVTGLQDALNRNLAALAGSKNFEQTVMSLAAAIHLLNSRLGDMPAAPAVQLGRTKTGQAA